MKVHVLVCTVKSREDAMCVDSNSTAIAIAILPWQLMCLRVVLAACLELRA